jgi:hypothetical protein
MFLNMTMGRPDTGMIGDKSNSDIFPASTLANIWAGIKPAAVGGIMTGGLTGLD